MYRAPAELSALIVALAGTNWFASEVAPQTWDELRVHGVADRLPVWNGASETSIYGSDEVNWAYRAWHDRLHLVLGADFSPEGERAVALAHRAIVGRLLPECPEAAEAIWADSEGQNLYFRRHGRFPDNQAAFVGAWLTRGEAAALNEVF